MTSTGNRARPACSPKGNPINFRAIQDESPLNKRISKQELNRAAWGTIIKNIAIALIPVFGILAIPGQLIHSKATKGRALFFGQKDRTTSGSKVSDVQASLDNLSREDKPKIWRSLCPGLFAFDM